MFRLCAPAQFLRVISVWLINFLFVPSRGTPLEDLNTGCHSPDLARPTQFAHRWFAETPSDSYTISDSLANLPTFFDDAEDLLVRLPENLHCGGLNDPFAKGSGVLSNQAQTWHFGPENELSVFHDPQQRMIISENEEAGSMNTQLGQLNWYEYLSEHQHGGMQELWQARPNFYGQDSCFMDTSVKTVDPHSHSGGDRWEDMQERRQAVQTSAIENAFLKNWAGHCNKDDHMGDHQGAHSQELWTDNPVRTAKEVPLVNCAGSNAELPYLQELWPGTPILAGKGNRSIDCGETRVSFHYQVGKNDHKVGHLPEHWQGFQLLQGEKALSMNAEKNSAEAQYLQQVLDCAQSEGSQASHNALTGQCRPERKRQRAKPSRFENSGSAPCLRHAHLPPVTQKTPSSFGEKGNSEVGLIVRDCEKQGKWSRRCAPCFWCYLEAFTVQRLQGKGWVEESEAREVFTRYRHLADAQNDSRFAPGRKESRLETYIEDTCVNEFRGSQFDGYLKAFLKDLKLELYTGYFSMDEAERRNLPSTRMYTYTIKRMLPRFLFYVKIFCMLFSSPSHISSETDFIVSEQEKAWEFYKNFWEQACVLWNGKNFKTTINRSVSEPGRLKIDFDTHAQFFEHCCFFKPTRTRNRTTISGFIQQIIPVWLIYSDRWAKLNEQMTGAGFSLSKEFTYFIYDVFEGANCNMPIEKLLGGLPSRQKDQGGLECVENDTRQVRKTAPIPELQPLRDYLNQLHRQPNCHIPKNKDHSSTLNCTEKYQSAQGLTHFWTFVNWFIVKNLDHKGWTKASEAKHLLERYSQLRKKMPLTCCSLSERRTKLARYAQGLGQEELRMLNIKTLSDNYIENFKEKQALVSSNLDLEGQIRMKLEVKKYSINFTRAFPFFILYLKLVDRLFRDPTNMQSDLWKMEEHKAWEFYKEKMEQWWIKRAQDSDLTMGKRFVTIYDSHVYSRLEKVLKGAWEQYFTPDESARVARRLVAEWIIHSSHESDVLILQIFRNNQEFIRPMYEFLHDIFLFASIEFEENKMKSNVIYK